MDVFNGIPTPVRHRSSRLELENRLDRVEEMLAGGFPSGSVARKLAAEWSISRRQVEKYIRRAHERRERERLADAPYRRESLLRKMERFYAKAMSQEKFGPAAQILIAEMRLSGAFDQTADRDALVQRLGPPPEDPGEMLVYTRRVLMASLYEAMLSPFLDVEKRQRIIADLAFKIAATQSRTEIEAEMLKVEALVASRRELPPAAEIVNAKAAGWGEAEAGQGRPRGSGALPGPGAAPGPGEDGGDAPSSGGPLGPT